jgi:hypothetical protein
MLIKEISKLFPFNLKKNLYFNLSILIKDWDYSLMEKYFLHHNQNNFVFK